MTDPATPLAGEPADRTGEPAAPFVLVDTSGTTVRLADFRGSWLLLVFLRHHG